MMIFLPHGPRHIPHDELCRVGLPLTAEYYTNPEKYGYLAGRAEELFTARGYEPVSAKRKEKIAAAEAKKAEIIAENGTL